MERLGLLYSTGNLVSGPAAATAVDVSEFGARLRSRAGNDGD